MEATRLSTAQPRRAPVFTIGVCATSDPRIDRASRQRCVNITKMAAEKIACKIIMPDGNTANVAWSPILIDGYKQADIVARQFKEADVGAIVVVPDTWAFPQLTLISLLAHFPKDLPVNITCGNSGPKPGVVYAHAVNGALAQSGRLSALNVGTWPDKGMRPVMTDETARALIDWCYSAMTYAGLKGKRVMVLGHDSMGMETALAHVIPTRNKFGLEIARLDMKLLSDMLQKRAYKATELSALYVWLSERCGRRIQLNKNGDQERFTQSLAMYLIVRDLMKDMDAIGGGFMSQLEWGSDKRGIPLPVADVMESLFNSTFDHNGPKPALPFATEADAGGLLTMVFQHSLSGGNPPLFMDFRKVWEPWEIQKLAKKLGVATGVGAALDDWAEKGLVDGDNSGSASFNWAKRPGASAGECMAGVSMPQADPGYFPGKGNSVTFISPGGIEGITGRLHFDQPRDTFCLLWDETITVELPTKLAEAVAKTSTPDWPHTFWTSECASMVQWKQFTCANHVHSVWNLNPARVQHWIDMTGVKDVHASKWPKFRPGIDRPLPLLQLVRM